MYISGIRDTKPAISLKRSGLARVTTECLQKLVYGLSMDDNSSDLA